MLIVDDILLFPIRSLFWILREIHHAAQEEIVNEADAITTELSELYMMLETKKITDTEFDDRERELLDRLEIIQRRGFNQEEETEEGQG